MLIKEVTEVQTLRKYIERISESEDDIDTKIQQIPEIFGGARL